MQGETNIAFSACLPTPMPDITFFFFFSLWKWKIKTKAFTVIIYCWGQEHAPGVVVAKRNYSENTNRYFPPKLLWCAIPTKTGFLPFIALGLWRLYTFFPSFFLPDILNAGPLPDLTVITNRRWKNPRAFLSKPSAEFKLSFKNKN